MQGKRRSYTLSDSLKIILRNAGLRGLSTLPGSDAKNLEAICRKRIDHVALCPHFYVFPLTWFRVFAKQMMMRPHFLWACS